MKTNQGFIKWVVIIVIALIILGYYGFDLRKAIESPTNQNNFSYIQSVTYNVWNNYLKGPATYLWKEIFIKVIWNPAIDNLKKIGNNQPTVIDQSAPKLPEPSIVK